MATESSMSIGGHHLRVNPHEVRWNFTPKVSDTKALTGKVIQIIGVTLSDITITGRYTPDRRHGDTHAWQQAMRFRDQVKAWTKAAETAKGDRAVPVRFVYPERNWDFQVFVSGLSPTTRTVSDVAPVFTLTLTPVDGEALDVVKGIKDLYIERLMNGIGWKQTAYNGPAAEEVAEELGGRTPLAWSEDQYAEAANGNTGDGEGQ